MFEALKTACLIQGGIHENEDRLTSKEAIKMATINGAKLLKLDDKVGSIEEGKDADIIVMKGKLGLDTDAMVYYTMIEGKIVYQK